MRSQFARGTLPLSLVAVLAAPILMATHTLIGLPLFLLVVLGLAGIVFSTRGILKRWI